MIKIKIIILALFLAFGAFSCNKYLDAKPDSLLNVPSTLDDLQLLLDNYTALNNQYPTQLETLSDNFYINTNDWNTMSEAQRNIYLWIKTDNTSEIWYPLYQSIYNTNVVLDNLNMISYNPDQQNMYNSIKGTALFFRAFYFYMVAELFTVPYDPASAKNELGIPLRLSSSFLEKSTRPGLEETYLRIINDLKDAAGLLPDQTNIKTRPTKAAAFGLLSKVFLTIKNYDEADINADKCLSINNSLLDYNLLDPISSNPFERFNKEVVFQMVSTSVFQLTQSIGKIDSVLYSSYHPKDLRKALFFTDNGDNTWSFKGDYDGMNQGATFGGIVTDEIYLISAECKARLGNIALARQALNTLMEKRWKSDEFVPVTSADPTDLIKKILIEKRKELICRGARWSDLRRTSNESPFAETIKRKINDQIYELRPGSSRYALLIPQIVISNTGMSQNK